MTFGGRAFQSLGPAKLNVLLPYFVWNPLISSIALPVLVLNLTFKFFEHCPCTTLNTNSRIFKILAIFHNPIKSYNSLIMIKNSYTKKHEIDQRMKKGLVIFWLFDKGNLTVDY